MHYMRGLTRRTSLRCMGRVSARPACRRSETGGAAVPIQAVERKLAPIFVADIAGYSRMGQDEVGTLARLLLLLGGYGPTDRLPSRADRQYRR
jgi:hypothetical protein